MHIVTFAFESVGFDVRMMRGGLASLVWNLAREYADQGHRVSVITPAHGCLDHLRAGYDLEQLDHLDRHRIPLVLDPEVWPGHEPETELRLTTRAYRLRYQGVDLYFLSDEYLDLLPERIYPPRADEGVDLSFFKPLAFQVSGLRFLRSWFGAESEAAGSATAEPVIVQAYEPYYHYLLPPVLQHDPRYRVVSTVASNMPINQKLYRPQLQRLLALFDADADLDRYLDPPVVGALAEAMAAHLPSTHLTEHQGQDYLGYFPLIAATCDLIDFLTPGQRDFYSAFRDTPFELAYQQLAVSSTVKATAAKQFVGGCAVPTEWLRRDPASADRAAVLAELGLDPRLPTFYHVARFSVHHKGQVELFRAIDAVLAVDPDVNFVVRCAMAAGGEDVVSRVGDRSFQEIADRYPDRVRLDWTMAGEDVLYQEATAADFCLFPSKFELDSFLIAQGQLMACGAVPIGTAQEVTSHYRHQLPREDPRATGFSVPRSFTEDDPLLFGALVERIHEAVQVYREDQSEYRRLAANSRALAHSFTWREAADARLIRFAAAAAGELPGLSVERAAGYGWFDAIAPADWIAGRGHILRAAEERGDLEAYRRCAPVGPPVLRRLFQAAYRRGDFPRCQELAAALDDDELTALLRGRCRAERLDQGWRVEYRLPHADSVLLLLPDGEHRMARTGGVFRAALPQHPPLDSLVFLLRLHGGRAAWDELPLADCLPVPSAAAGAHRERA